MAPEAATLVWKTSGISPSLSVSWSFWKEGPGCVAVAVGEKEYEAASERDNARSLKPWMEMGERMSPVLSSLDAQGLLAHKVGPVSDGILCLVQFVPEQVMLGSCHLIFVITSLFHRRKDLGQE